MESLNGTIIEAEVIEALRSCFDPEIPVNIYDLGLIYDVKVSPEGAVDVQMTLTSPHCPAVQSLPAEVESKIKAVPGVTDAKIESGLGSALGSKQNVRSCPFATRYDVKHSL